MKGYAEERGMAFKMAFDAVTGQFVSKPVAHAFEPSKEPSLVLQKLKDLARRRQAKKATRRLDEQLAGMSPEIRDDVGMTQVFAASNQF